MMRTPTTDQKFCQLCEGYTPCEKCKDGWHCTLCNSHAVVDHKPESLRTFMISDDAKAIYIDGLGKWLGVEEVKTAINAHVALQAENAEELLKCEYEQVSRKPRTKKEYGKIWL